MGLVMFRIDDRLIHGQVVTFWSRRLDVDRIVIADDAVAKDPFISKVLKMTAPPGVNVNMLTQEETLAAYEAGKFEKYRLMLLVKTPENAKALIDGGLKAEVLNVGGMGAKPGATSLFKNLSATPEQIDIFRELTERGVNVEFRILPDDDALTFDQLKLP